MQVDTNLTFKHQIGEMHLTSLVSPQDLFSINTIAESGNLFAYIS